MTYYRLQHQMYGELVTTDLLWCTQFHLMGDGLMALMDADGWTRIVIPSAGVVMLIAVDQDSESRDDGDVTPTPEHEPQPGA